jgi:hypothetical protein
MNVPKLINYSIDGHVLKWPRYVDNKFLSSLRTQKAKENEENTEISGR